MKKGWKKTEFNDFLNANKSACDKRTTRLSRCYCTIENGNKNKIIYFLNQIKKINLTNKKQISHWKLKK